MARRSSSQRWLQRQARDPYVHAARSSGLRSRASFKLRELDDREHLFRPGQCVVDLGAAPGGWSQVAVERVAPGGQVFALDILPMDPLPGVTFLRGDFRQEPVYGELLALLPRGAELVLSDMAPNISGIRSADQAGAMLLAELALDLCREVLRPGGGAVIKVFQGEGFDELLSLSRQYFRRCRVRKPKASRPDSREMYLVATQFRPDGGGGH